MSGRRGIRSAGVSLPAGPAGSLAELRGPTRAELRAIDAEWPAIAASLAEVDLLIAVATAGAALPVGLADVDVRPLTLAAA